MKFNFFMPSNVLFGAGRLNELATGKLPGKKALIVTGGTSIKKFGYLDRVIGLLAQNKVSCVVFDKIQPNPILAHVAEGAALARSEGCDFVIGLGGGSSIDSAKSIALMATNEGDYWDYISGGSGKGLEAKHTALPIVAITTTAGTGTESDPWTVITKEDTHEKIGFGSKDTFPTLSIVDPELMTTVPPAYTAFQGFDALFHSTEGFIANISSPISDLFALKSIEYIFKYLPKAVENGEDVETRSYVAMANTFSGIVESTSSCTSSHSIAHAISAFHPEVPHGAALIAISVSYYTFFQSKIPEKLKEMACATGDASQDFVTALKQLIKAAKVDHIKLSNYGITQSDLAAMADNAFDTMGGLFQLDRCTLTKDDVVGILSQAL